RVVTIFLGQLLRGKPLTVIGDGRQTRAFTYVDDAVRATVQAGLRPEAVGQVINVGSEEEVSIAELAELMVRISGSPSAIEYVPQEAVYGPGYEDIRRRVPSTGRMRELLGVAAEIPIEEGLRRTIEWFRQEWTA
ncbi:MAG: NAD-dependent epimerase/dehydratase family protein, partial [Candidatus Rokubacteria bacterium]|nr:NAD-dependent epimerase/dehydratase family protein [Candidatus Rokubacteria bacterium]